MLSSIYLYLYCLNSSLITLNLVLFEGSQFGCKTEFGLGEGRPRRQVELCQVINLLSGGQGQIPLHTRWLWKQNGPGLT